MASKTVVLVTGGNSGIGFACCEALAKMENVHVIVAGRNPTRIEEAVAKIRAKASPTSTVEAGIVDLSSLKAVKQYAQELLDRKLQFTTIVCNAGGQALEKSITEDGFERTIGVNHIAHFLLLKLLKASTKRIVMVGSETHDRDLIKIMQPSLDNLEDTARGVNFDTNNAYSTSKLYNVTYAVEFARRYPEGPEIVSYAPGFTPDTAFFRDEPGFVWAIKRPIIMVFNWCVGIRNSTSEYSGGFLAGIAAADSWTAKGWQRGDYLCVDQVVPSAVDARNPEKGKALWDKSEEWVKPFVV